MSIYRTLVKNIVSNWANLLLNVIIGFALMPFVVHRLGDSLYGVWILVISITGYGGLLDFGIRNSVIKYVSEYEAKGDRKALNDILNSSIVFFVLIGVSVAAITIVFANRLPDLFNISADMKGSTAVTLCLVGVSVALKFPFSVFESFISGVQRYEITNGILMAMTLLRTILTVVYLNYGYKLIALALVSLACELGGGIIAAVACFRLLPYLKLNLLGLHRATLRRLFGYGIFGFVILLSMRVMYQTDSIVIGLYLPTEMITVYAVAGNLIRYVMLAANGFGNVFNPAASAMQARSQEGQIQELFVKATRFGMVIVLPMILGCLILGKEFITLWMGKAYADQSSRVLYILALAHLFSMSQYAARDMLFGINRHKMIALISSVQAAANIVLSVVLVRPWGIFGVAAGTAIPEIIAATIVYPWFICRINKMPIGRYVREAFLPPLAGGAVFAGVLMLMDRAVASESWATMVSKATAGLIVYGVACYYTCLDAGERSLLRGRIAVALGRTSQI